MTRKLIVAFAALALVAALFAGAAQARRLSTLVAPTSACPNQTDLGESPAVQEQAMHCMTDFAREKAGLGDLGSQFGTSRPRWQGAPGAALLAETARLLAAAGFTVGNVAIQVIGYRPRISARREEAEKAGRVFVSAKPTRSC